MPTVLRQALVLIAGLTDVIHAVAMAAWGIGLPLLVWHRWPRLSRGYVWYGLFFTLLSFFSHELIGECFLTRIARDLRVAAGAAHDDSSFTLQLVELVAGVRPTERWVVVLWQVALLVTTTGALYSLKRSRRSASANGERLAVTPLLSRSPLNGAGQSSLQARAGAKP